MVTLSYEVKRLHKLEGNGKLKAFADIAVNDLYGLVMSNVDNPEVLWDGGGIHFTTEGAALQGKQVAESILAAMPGQPDAK